MHLHYFKYQALAEHGSTVQHLRQMVKATCLWIFPLFPHSQTHNHFWCPWFNLCFSNSCLWVKWFHVIRLMGKVWTGDKDVEGVSTLGRTTVCQCSKGKKEFKTFGLEGLSLVHFESLNAINIAIWVLEGIIYWSINKGPSVGGGWGDSGIRVELGSEAGNQILDNLSLSAPKGHRLKSTNNGSILSGHDKTQ